jgi:uncharacterized protein (DUF2336 family)
MSALHAIAPDVERALSSNNHPRRAHVMRQIMALFLEHAPRLKGEQVDLFDGVLLRLVQDLEFKALLDLSERLADLGNAPPKTLGKLALDPAIEVARPILERSPSLTDADLVEVASQRDEPHLLILANRPLLPEQVTDVVVERGTNRVLYVLTSNGTAHLSGRSYSRLVERARSDPDLSDALQDRADLPDEAWLELIRIARDTAAAALKADLGRDAADIIEAVLATMKEEPGKAPAFTFAGSEAWAAEVARRGELTEDKVIGWIKGNKLEDVLAVLAHLLNLPVQAVGRAYFAPTYDPLLILVRAANFGWPIFKLLLSNKAGRAPSTASTTDAFEAFRSLSAASAQRVVRFMTACAWIERHNLASRQ